MILAAKDDAAEPPLGASIVERDARLVEKARKASPQPEQIADHFAQTALAAPARAARAKTLLS